jgi:uncharacterized protein with HEPN domain
MKYTEFGALSHIKNYCVEIENALKRFGDDYEIFVNDKDYRDLMTMKMIQIGEIANSAKDCLNPNESVNWKQVVNIRNRFVHGYSVISPRTIWNTIKTEIPQIKRYCEEIIQNS